MLNREIKQNPLWEKSKHKLLHYLQSSAFILMSVDACVSVCVIWYWCSPVMCADVVPEESQCNWAYAAFSVGVHVVSATPLDSRFYVTCSYVFVFCHVFKVSFFLYNSFSSSSSTAAGISGSLDVIQLRLTKPNPALGLWHLGRKAGLLSRRLERPPRDRPSVFRPQVGVDIPAIPASLSSSSPESTWLNPKADTSNTDGIHGR